MSLKLRRTAGMLACLCLLLQMLSPAAGLAAPADEPAAASAGQFAEAAQDAPDSGATVPEDSAEAGSPADEDAVISFLYENTPECTFRIEGETPQALAEADFLVWTEPDRTDEKRLNAEADGSSWSAALDLADFHYRFGTYHVQMVGRSQAGGVVPWSAAAELEVLSPAAGITIAPAAILRNRSRITLTSEPLPGSPEVWFEVRAEDGSTVLALPAQQNGSGYSAVLDTDLLGSAGAFRAVACAGHMGECSQEIAEAELDVPVLTFAGLSFEGDGSAGTIAYTLSAGSPLGIGSARIAIWSDPDQADLHWIEMNPDGRAFRCPPQNVMDYSGFGTYHAHAYVRLGDGQELLAAAMDQTIAARNFVTAERTGAGSYSIRIENPSSLRDLRAAVWSETDGQDDLVWYPVTAADGVYSATAMASRHADGGTWHAHIYSSDTFLGAVSFTVPESELLSAAEQRIARGCQRVYNEVGTDLHDNYLWVVRNLSYVRRSGHLTPPSGYTRAQWYAVEGLEKQTGNCYTYASTFCELAKGLGYDAQYVEGAVFGVGQQWWPHGFVLITIDGSTYICDPELQYASSTGRNLYMQPISNPRATYRW
ncbi:MAG: hypothetical protein HDQ87_04050 [Clostridia bacterium]|nr:hypothetical protein [Clostridia bacterium]